MQSQDDLAPLFESIREGPVYQGEWLSAASWAELLKKHAPYGGLSQQLDKLISSAARLSNRMEQTKDRLGLEARRPAGHEKQYRLRK